MADDPKITTDAKALDLAKSYDVGHDVPLAEASPEPAPDRPRDESGRFVKPEEKPQPSRSLIRRALSVGMTDEEIDAADPEALEELVWSKQAQALEEARAQSRERALHESTKGGMRELIPGQGEAAQADDEYDPELPEDIYDEKIIKAFKKLGGQHKKELKELREELAHYRKRDQARETISTLERIDSHFANKYADVLGKERGIHLKEDHPMMIRRRAVLTIAGADRSSATLEEKIDKACKAIFGDKAAAAEDTSKLKRDWEVGSLARPTNRGGAAEPVGVEKARRAVREHLNGLSGSEDATPPTSLEEFL